MYAARVPAPTPFLRAPVLGASWGILALAVYVLQLPEGYSLHGDSAEMAAAAHLGGVGHAPGYSYLTWVGYLTSSVSGQSDRALHFLSALFHASTVVVVFHTTLRETKNALIASSTALGLALCGTFFRASHYFEVFPLAHLLCAGVLLTSACRQRLERPG